MKKLSLLLILVMSVLMLKAGGEATSYVNINGKIYFCESVKSGLFNLNLTLNDGTIMKVPFKKVDSYTCNGRLFERLPVIYNGEPSNYTALMEYVAIRNGFKLFRHCEYIESGNLWDNSYKKSHLQVEYYVYKDGKLHLQATTDNIESVLEFFHIDVL